LWLNEGFARYMQGFGAQHIQKTDTGIVDRLVTSSTMTAMDKGNWKKLCPGK
jgi:aminopeptidase N